MRRPFNPSADYSAKSGSIKYDFSQGQLAAIGAVAMVFNEVEDDLLTIFGVVTGLSGAMLTETYTRINGLDGVVAIIKKGAERLSLPKQGRSALAATLGEFSRLKKFRDAVIHARAHNAPAGVGVRLERKGRSHEVLMTQEALEALFDHLASLRHELSEAVMLLLFARLVMEHAPDDPIREQYESGVAESLVPYLARRTSTQSLRPLPAFPRELELLEARDRWLGRIEALRDSVVEAARSRQPSKE